jgi:hypothetical protein
MWSAGKIFGYIVLSVERTFKKRVFSNFRGDLLGIVWRERNMPHNLWGWSKILL